MSSPTHRQQRTTPAPGGSDERSPAASGKDRRGQGAARSDSESDPRGRGLTKDARGGIDVTILGRHFRIACADDEKEALTKAVEYLDAKMRAIRDSGKVIGIERIAVMAALNIAHEYLSTAVAPGFDMGEFRRRIHGLEAVIDQAMTAQDELF